MPRGIAGTSLFGRTLHAAPPEIRQTVSNILAMLCVDPPAESESILIVTEAVVDRSEHPMWIACLGDVLATYQLPEGENLVVMVDLLWFPSDP